MQGTDRAWFLPVAIIAWSYIILRAAMVPWVHDESTSLYWFLERGEYLPYRSLWDAGNHFLSSALGAWGHQLWGLSLPGSRMGSVLAFPLYAWATYRVGAFLQDRLVRTATLVALLLCPFLLDFFSLFRGYGPGMAFFMVAVDGALRYWKNGSLRSMGQLLLGMCLANMAMLTLVPLWVLAACLIGLHLLNPLRRRGTLPRNALATWTFLGAVPLMGGLLLAWEMKRRGLLYHGSLEGFIPVTIASLTRYTLGSDHIAVLIIVTAILLTACAVVFLRRTTAGAWVVVAGAVIAEVFMRTWMAKVLRVNYPEDRAALHLLPLGILLVGGALDTLAGTHRIARWATLLLWCLPLHTAMHANLDHTRLWPEQSVPTRFLAHAAMLQQRLGRPVIVGAYHQLSLAIPYMARVEGLLLGIPDTQGFPHTPADLRIVDDRFLHDALTGYRILDHAPGPGSYLLERDASLQLVAIGQWPLEAHLQDTEGHVLWRQDTLPVQQDLFFLVEAEVHSPAPFLDLQLVVEQRAQGELLHRHTQRLAAAAPWLRDAPLRQMIRMPHMPAADEREVYFWLPGRQSISIRNGRVLLLAQGPHP